MPKNKTHSGTKKRFRVTGSGKVMRQQAGHVLACAAQQLGELPKRLNGPRLQELEGSHPLFRRHLFPVHGVHDRTMR